MRNTLLQYFIYYLPTGHANQTFSVFGEAFYNDLKMKSFKKYMLSMSNARLTINKSEVSNDFFTNLNLEILIF